jgi:hypothetical protein
MTPKPPDYDPFNVEIDDSRHLEPEPPNFAERLRQAVDAARRIVGGNATETERARFLAEASCPEDLERRLQVWEQAQRTQGKLPPPL